MIANIVFSIPVFGWAVREAVRGGAQAKTLFLLNCIMLWALAILLYGYPAIIVPALGLVPVLFAFVIAVSWPHSLRPGEKAVPRQAHTEAGFSLNRRDH